MKGRGAVSICGSAAMGVPPLERSREWGSDKPQRTGSRPRTPTPHPVGRPTRRGNPPSPCWAPHPTPPEARGLGAQPSVSGRGGAGEKNPTQKDPHPYPDAGPFNWAVLTGFEPAASTLTGWRALQTAPQDLVSQSLATESHIGYCTALRCEKRLYRSRAPRVELTQRTAPVTEQPHRSP